MPTFNESVISSNGLPTELIMCINNARVDCEPETVESVPLSLSKELPAEPFSSEGELDTSSVKVESSETITSESGTEPRHGSMWGGLLGAISKGRKRAYPWEDCNDVHQLKKMLLAKHSQILKLQKELADAKQVNTTGTCANGSVHEETPAEIREKVKSIKKSVANQISAQMVYKVSVKNGSAKLAAEVPNVTEAQALAFFGEEVLQTANNGNKQLKVSVDNQELAVILGKTFSKSLRYGATLVISNGLKFIFDKTTGRLTATGSYVMIK
eukprot:Colp12_sorted_trinity150504_noHs@33838